MRLKRMGNKTDWRNSAKEMFCSEQGSALVEFALCLPMLVVVLAGIVDYGEMIQVSMLVTQAASAGAAYGAIPGNNNDLAGMQAAGRNSASGLVSLTVSAVDIYSCTAGGTAVLSSNVCSGYGTPIKYAQVKASATFQPILPFDGLSSPTTLQSTSSFRVLWTP
jgi:Flp pilus assembly protein TadG